jgi:hypothetical protein
VKADVHIVNDRTPVLEVRRNLVNHLLAVGSVGSLVGVVADQLAITVMDC